MPFRNGAESRAVFATKASPILGWIGAGVRCALPHSMPRSPTELPPAQARTVTRVLSGGGDSDLWKFGFMEVWFLGAGLFLASSGAAFDVATRRIPNQLTYGGIVIGIVFWTATAGWRGLGTAILGMLIGGGVFLLLYLVRAMGAGDVKLMAAVGSIVGAQKSVETIFACAIAGGVMAIGYMLFHRRTHGTLANVGKLLRFHMRHGAKSHPELNLSNPTAIRMPYGVAIAAGCLYSFCMTLLKR